MNYFMDSERKKKLDELKRDGVEPYAYSFKRTHYADEIAANYDKLEGKRVRVAGRLTQIRSFGKLAFAHLQDDSGKIQVVARTDKTDAKSFALFMRLDAGDFIGGEGVVTKTKKGEKSVELASVQLLAKSLRVPPEKFHGLQETELRYRKRYLDLMVNPEVREIFRARAKIVSEIRRFLDERGFVEVETPILQPVYGGAAAKPFTTVHNFFKKKLFLRVADELYLKRLIVGGFERVYEIGKDFRNEGVDSMHNPEFTQLEFYQAYADYEEIAGETEELLGAIAKRVWGSLEGKYGGKPLSFKPPFKRVHLAKAIKEKIGVDILAWRSDAEAAAAAKKLGLDVAIKTRQHVVDALFAEHVQPALWQPTFVFDYPDYMCPLAKKKRGEPILRERFELFIAGKECGNCYSELNDPLDQRTKLEEQAKERAAGDGEASFLMHDEDFLEALEHGMPPLGGIGIGVDRLAMIFTDQSSIKEVILFPSMKPLDADA
ncbi:MAG: lysine--tRNA ligase [Candidatus Micrarchaeota archaeon]